MEIDSRNTRRLIRKRQSRERLLDRVVRRWAWVDPVAEVTQKGVGAFYGALGAPGRVLKNLMHGTTLLGHPLHPALTDVPIGAWTVGVLADWLYVTTGSVPAVAGDLALAIGLAAAILAALAGLTDHHDTDGFERRTATVHGLTMVSVVIIDAVSGIMRRTPELRLSAIVLASMAYLLALLGAYIGGHLTFGSGTGINHNAFADGPADYVKVGRRDDFPEGEMRRVMADGLPVVIVRREGLLQAMGAVCAHAGGPLEEGKLEGDVVTCPWHSSRFRFSDGKVVGGPATFDQPSLFVRERAGIVEVKLAHPIQ
ncbi:MAG TPA: Rieske (2Fe-2S) protein [Candidatus Dormibacteraeota bacterium]